MNAEINIELLKQVNRASFDAFIETGKYALSKRQAYEQFGKSTIELLITNRLLSDAKMIEGTKCRFILSDVIAALTVFKNLNTDKRNIHTKKNKTQWKQD
jgi:hypothetical protein